eukprot:3484622-Pleurochrysis_carterae.AAC.2
MQAGLFYLIESDGLTRWTLFCAEGLEGCDLNLLRRSRPSLAHTKQALLHKLEVSIIVLGHSNKAAKNSLRRARRLLSGHCAQPITAMRVAQQNKLVSGSYSAIAQPQAGRSYTTCQQSLNPTSLSGSAAADRSGLA